MTLIAKAPVDVESLIDRAKALMQATRFGEAADLCDNILVDTPDNRDALYIGAVAQRYSRNYQIALGLIDRLIMLDPSYGRAYQERGHCLRDEGNSSAALPAYERAVSYNGALAASWKMLAELYAAEGEDAAAAQATTQFQRLSALPPLLLSVESFIAEGRLLKAEKLCRSFLQTHGHNVEAMRLLAQIGTKFNSYDEAEFLLESCLVLEPDFLLAHFDYVQVLGKRQKFDKALEQATALRAKDPGNSHVEILYANENLSVGNFAEALSVFRAQLAKVPNNPSINLSLGHALKTIGQQSEAIEAYTQAAKIRPDFGDAYWSLANLKTYRFTDDQITAMRQIEAGTMTTLADRYHLCFALGKALEDQGQFGASFHYYESGNRLKRDELQYDWRRITTEIDLQITHADADLFATLAGAGCPAPDPIFILGLPRAGSTLLEQILASHSHVEGTMELPNILALAHRLDGLRRIDEEARYPGNLSEISREDYRSFGESFIRDTRIHRKANTPFFIDKMPNNFRHIGLIQLILPNAKIIDARRGAMGCCFSGFKQLFAEGQDFTYGLEEVGHYYRDYVRLMAHWHAVLPGKILQVNYEEVVSDTETQVRRILDYCGLPFEEACLNFHQNDRAVRTASSEQVRQPIFTSGLDQWTHFAPYLDRLRETLGPELATT